MRAGLKFTGGKLWRVTDGAETALRAEAERRQKYRRIRAGLAKCLVCGREANIVQFGRGGKGVWIGCDRTEACCRYIEYHAEGWSIEETARDWNRRNRGFRKWIRLLKKWIYDRFGEQKRAERRYLRELEAKKSREIALRRERFGFSEPKEPTRWWKFVRKGNK